MSAMSVVTARVRVAPVTDPDAAAATAVRGLRVAHDQARFVGDTAFNLGDTLRDPMSEAMAVYADDEVVGFYRLDFAPNAVVGRSLGAPAVGLRAFVIDQRAQGRGYGTRAMTACCDDLRLRHPDRALLVLTVNVANPAAIAAYLRAGFVDTGELFHGGSAGAQHIMLYSLRSVPTP
jgi:RimJ/RimL family protein N-acetyltransferase